MKARFISGLIGLPLLVILIFVGQGQVFAIAVAGLAMLALVEFYRGVRMTGANVQEWIGHAFVLLFVYSATNHYHSKGLLFNVQPVMTLLLITALTIELARSNRDPIKDIGGTFLGVAYPSWLFSYLVALRFIGGTFTVQPWGWSVSSGVWFVLLVVLSAWTSDTFALLIGRKWGKHKLAPILSPGKTWEGAFAGVVGCCLISWAMTAMVDIARMNAVVFGVAIAIASLFGDLAKSSIKRSLGIKDFGSIIPGHGGVLDRFDGLLFASPLLYYYVTMVLGF